MNDHARELLRAQNECTLCWSARDGRAVATIVSFVELEGALWMTALEGTARVQALRRDPRATVVVTGKGTHLGAGRCVSLQGRCHFEADPEVRSRFFTAFAHAVLPHSEKGATAMARSMDTPANLAIVFQPRKVIPYDSAARMARADSL